MSLAGSPRFSSLLRLAALFPFPALAFLYACHGLDETDFWWHVRTGQWILETGQLPDKDPFSFASANERFIDIYWLFQIALAFIYARAAAAGVVVFGAVLAALAVLMGLTVRGKSANVAIIALCWAPGLLLLGFRLPLRPELVTLVFLAADLAILRWAKKWPRLVWALPAIQLVWVNCHGLFIFGPILIAFWWIDSVVRWRWPGDSPFVMPSRDMTIASAGVALACFINPYGVSGALLPLILFPKVSSSANPYRDYIAEFNVPAKYFAHIGREAVVMGQDHDFYPQFALNLLLLLLPLSFLVPAVWRLNRRETSNEPGTNVFCWIAVFVGAAMVSCADAVLVTWFRSLPSFGTLRLLTAGSFLVAGGAGFWALPSVSAKRLSLAVGIAMPIWIWWLGSYFAETPSLGAGAVLAALGLYLAVMIVRSGASLFALLLTLSFGYLGLSAGCNLGRLGFVGAIVLCGNLGDWAAEIKTSSMPRWLGPALEAIAGTGLWLWLGAALGGVENVPGRLRPGAFAETPDLFPHDAARFAGQPGMPSHALPYGLAAANVFVFHNGPDRKVFMDARLEVPSIATFLAYRDMERLLLAGDPSWATALENIGNPALILEHKHLGYNAQATVLVHPNWRLVHFDTLAAVFVPRQESDREPKVPTLDLAARHFAASQPAGQPAALEKESIALGNLGLALLRHPGATWSARIPVLLSALDRAQKLEAGGGAATAPLLFSIGSSCWAMQPDPAAVASTPPQGWVAYSDVRWSQLTFALAQARRLSPRDSRNLVDLYKVFRTRRLIDAQRETGIALLATDALDAKDRLAVLQQLDEIPPPVDLAGVDRTMAKHDVVELARAGYPEAATRLAEMVGESVWSQWEAPATDALADAWMRLGHPDRARHVWQKAANPESLRQARVAATFWVDRKLAAAAEAYESARQSDPKLAEAHWALAWINTERGLAGPALADCQKALECSVPEPVRAELMALAAFLRNHTPAEPK